jgi:hypothetical protein
MSFLSSLFGSRSKQDRVSFAIGEMELLVQGWGDSELRQIISDFQRMYSDQLPKNFSTEIHACPGWVLRVTFPAGIEPDCFCFLINYANYPRGFDLKSRSILIVGRATVNSDFLPADQSVVGERILLYVPANDKDFDVIYAQVKGQSYSYPFSSERWQRVDDPRIPEELIKLSSAV